MFKKTKPILGITMGDPTGVGPEISIKALAEAEVNDLARTVVIGDARIMTAAARIVGLDEKISVHAVSSLEECCWEPGLIEVMHLELMDPAELTYGKVSPRGGEAAFRCIRKAIELARNRDIAAVVTNPLNKEALNLAGYHYSGHTEIFADLTGTKDYAMMLMDDGFRVVHVSTHVSLREACDRVKRDRVLAVIRLAADAAKRLGVSGPHVAVAGLNPHAGEGGLFGREEIDEIIPAIRDAQDLGIKVDGPIPPDTVFAKARGGMYDIVVVMYHDQGHIPLKTAGFLMDAATGQWKAMSGVNVTLGLPIIRTSVDHGTAFGKAGKGTASAQSLIEAIKVATTLAASEANR